MKEKVIKMIFFLSGIFFFMVLPYLYSNPRDTLPYDPYGHCDVLPVKECRFFTRNLIIELEHSRKENVRESLEDLEKHLSDFFINYSYYEELFSFFSEAIKLETWNVPVDRKELEELTREILNFIGKRLKYLDKDEYKAAFFNKLTINPGCITTFENESLHSFVSITLDPSISPEEQDIVFFLLSAGFTLKYKERPPEPVFNSRFKVSGVSVNWIYASQYVYTGGPGGFPAPNTGGSPVNSYKITPAVNTELNQYLGNEDNKYPVNVYILDTIPEPGETAAACSSYCAINDLVNDFIGSIGSKYSITNYNGADPEFFLQGNDKYCNEDMSDHGIYIAGIIQRLSPHASIQLIEVLNSEGAGTTNSLLWGFREIQNRHGTNTAPFIVNCSLTTKIIPHTFDLPGRIDLIKKYIGTYEILSVFYAIRQNQELFSCLSAVIDFMHNYDCFIVAAAGNDSDNFFPFHWSPGFPALLGDYYTEKMIAVGACNYKGELTSYTNLPGNNGFLAYGGEVNSQKITVDGINSMYFSNSYGGTSLPNLTGWARWAGSSFSAGIISGALASLFASGPMTLSDARTKLMNSCSANSAGILYLPVF
ncbi:MAG: S8/S53 family peptidase [Spirochaetales bacterium]|nr:S8/S53 family peptidase [Spirochaetales bacterium]